MRTKSRQIITATAVAAFLAVPAAAAHADGPKPVPQSSSKRPVGDTVLLSKGEKAAPRSFTCDGVGHNDTRWWGNCRVHSGYARAVTQCSNGWRYGAWVGVGYWRFGGDCHGHRLLGYGVQTSP
ncbi:hypothetical protein DPM19_19275 [Actinomadura craniellae]|uniref:Secreted protein n=1 Tax=Actinomadura craniellae TaxID=2231787 RepID=A0A365H3V5_9ACTN|nr:hypothetical protein [Actinomadura craniellae]RAY13795.1 hypothetical protein DPM19_19275 [Actinomadura craniellae]